MNRNQNRPADPTHARIAASGHSIDFGAPTEAGASLFIRRVKASEVPEDAVLFLNTPSQ